MNVEAYTGYNKFTSTQIEGMHKIFINALQHNLNGIIYNIIMEWNWIKLFCVELSIDDLLKILDAAKTCKDFEYYPTFNNRVKFNVYENICSLFETYYRFDVLDAIQPI